MKKFKILFALLLIYSLGSVVWAEIPDKKTIVEQKNSERLSLDKIDFIEIKGLDVEKAIEEDRAKSQSPDKSAYRIGLAAEMAVNTGAPASLALSNPQGEAKGTWEETNDGHYLWRLRVKSVGAIGLSFGFTSFNLPAGATLYIYSLDHTWSIGPYTAKDNNPHNQLWTPAVLGEEAVLELKISKEDISKLMLVLGSVTHIYKNTFGVDKSGSCNVDVACSQESAGFEKQIRSVGRYSFSTNGSTYVCTGSLINNTNNDGRPYFLTAHHCLSDSTVAATVVVTWDYENATCRTPGSTESGTSLPLTGASQSGATFLATYASSDFTLLELDNAPEPSTDAFWTGWDRSGTNPSSGVSIHHPAGHAKRISHENDPLSTTSYANNTVPGDSSHFRVTDWDSGTTEGGSSGAGLWDSNGKIVGQLHGGYAACGNDDSDWYGRLFTSWSGDETNSTRLSNWLDPSATGVRILDGYEGIGSTVRTGFNSNILEGNDDGYTDLVEIGFEINFFGNLHAMLYVNNNGNITFDAPQGTYTPYDLTSTEREIIAPFFADVDTRNSENVTYGQGVVNGRSAFAVNWINVGYYSSHNSPLNTFQLVIIDRSDIAHGDFDIEFNYDHIGWETGDASSGSGGFGGSSARAGFSNGTGNTGSFYEIRGSAINGALIDGGSNALISGKYNSNILGRYIYEARNGSVDTPVIMPWLMYLLD